MKRSDNIKIKAVKTEWDVYFDIAFNRPWQHGIFKHVLSDRIQAQIPASLLRTHSNVTFCINDEIANGLEY